jgi:hypothetical protein
MDITTVHNVKTGEFFFSKKHSNYGLGKDWIPMSLSLPYKVKPRPSCPSGIVSTVEDYIAVFCDGETLIECPVEEEE